MKTTHQVAIAVLASLSLLVFERELDAAYIMNSNLVNQSDQVSETILSLNAEELSEPHWLRVRSSSSLSYLSGSIFCNGRIIKHLNNGTTEVDISPYLRSGENSISILGRYSPSITMIEIELTGPSNQVSQSASGDGDIQSNIVIDVQ